MNSLFAPAGFRAICSLMLCCFSLSWATGVNAGQRHVLISAKENVHVGEHQIKGDGWSVTMKRLHGGKQQGVDLITVDAGSVQFDVIPTRGMSVYQVRSGEMVFGWDSPVDPIVNPAFIDLESRGGLGWLEGFNEWMVRCGLEFAGHPGTDTQVVDGEEKSMDLTLHGKIGNIPAREVEVTYDEKGEGRLRIRGVIYEKFFYGPKLKLVTEISVIPGQSTYRIDDTVTNESSLPQEFQIIYHANYGAPLLSKGATMHAAIQSIEGMNDHATDHIKDHATYLGPTSGFAEQVYLIEPKADAEGKTIAVLESADGQQAASITWNVNQLPHLTQWKNTAAVEDGYVTGIEPATGYPFNRMVEREAGRVPVLQPGQTRRFTLDFGFHKNRQSVQSVISKVNAL